MEVPLSPYETSYIPTFTVTQSMGNLYCIQIIILFHPLKLECFIEKSMRYIFPQSYLGNFPIIHKNYTVFHDHFKVFLSHLKLHLDLQVTINSGD